MNRGEPEMMSGRQIPGPGAAFAGFEQRTRLVADGGRCCACSVRTTAIADHELPPAFASTTPDDVLRVSALHNARSAPLLLPATTRRRSMTVLSPEALGELSSRDVATPITGDELSNALSSPPFVPVEMINIRDIGLVPNCPIPAGKIYRCGQLLDNDESNKWIKQHVKAIFDLRKAGERKRSPDPTIEGVENVWFDPEQDGWKAQRLLIEDFERDNGSALGWAEQYILVLRYYYRTYRAALEHIRDKPDEPMLFHCSAGRDRTGVLAWIIEYLAGTPEDDRTFDYLLTRIGIEPARVMFENHFKYSWGITDLTNKGYLNAMTLSPDCFRLVTEGVNEEYGGWDGYLKEKLGFSDEDLETIRRNLRK